MTSAMANAVGANAIGAWAAIVLGLLVGGGLMWFAFSVLRRISRMESDAASAADAAATLEPLVAIDGEQRIVGCNGAAGRLFGFAAAGDLVGVPIERLMPDRHRAEQLAMLGGYLQAAIDRRAAPRITLHARRADGSECSLAATLARTDGPAPGLMLRLSEIVSP